MKLIIINSSNYVPKSGNKYIYSLPSSVKLTSKSKIGVSAISVYNSTFNITAARANNTFTFRFPSANQLRRLILCQAAIIAWSKSIHFYKARCLRIIYT